MRLVAAVLLLATGALGCLKMTPVDVEPADASADGRVESCQACLERPASPGPGCADALDACLNNPVCGRTYDCALASGCFSGNKGVLASCSMGCGFDAGMQSVSDPVVVIAASLFACIGSACGPTCFPNE